MKTYLLDTTAVLAFLEDRPGAESVEDILWKAVQAQRAVYLSVASFGEVMGIVLKSRGEQAGRELKVRLEQLPIELVPIDAENALEAARLSATNGLPFVDCFSLAAAQQRKAVLVTTNVNLDGELIGVKVQIVGKP